MAKQKDTEFLRRVRVRELFESAAFQHTESGILRSYESLRRRHPHLLPTGARRQLLSRTRRITLCRITRLSWLACSPCICRQDSDRDCAAGIQSYWDSELTLRVHNNKVASCVRYLSQRHHLTANDATAAADCQAQRIKSGPSLKRDSKKTTR
jgi:hypothetical protein